jgi:hypothetical protein
MGTMLVEKGRIVALEDANECSGVTSSYAFNHELCR